MFSRTLLKRNDLVAARRSWSTVWPQFDLFHLFGCDKDRWAINHNGIPQVHDTLLSYYRLSRTSREACGMLRWPASPHLAGPLSDFGNQSFSSHSIPPFDSAMCVCVLIGHVCGEMWVVNLPPTDSILICFWHLKPYAAPHLDRNEAILDSAHPMVYVSVIILLF